MAMLDNTTSSKNPLLGERRTSLPAHLGHCRATNSEIFPIGSLADNPKRTARLLLYASGTDHAILVHALGETLQFRIVAV